MATAYGSITVSKLTDIEDIYFEYSLAVNDANVTNNYPFSQVGELGWTINGESRKTPPAWQNGYKIWVREVKIKTDIATKIYGNPYPDTAINQTSTDLIALQSKIKKIWSNSTGSYMASGIGNNEIDTEVVSTYGFNSKTTTGGISFNYNAIPLTEFGVNGLKLYIPTIANNIVTNSNLGVELTTSALKFYDPTYHKAVMILTGSDLTFNKPNTTTAAAVLNNSGLILSSGGIEAGSKNTTDYIYLYSNDDATNHTLTINGHEASDWRIVAGNKFGVNKAGNLYASNVDISGKITSTEGKIGPWFINNNSISRNANGNAAGSYNTASNIYFGTSGLSLGTAFRVDSSGNLTATGATLTTATIGDGTNKITIGKSSNNSNYSALYSNSHSSLASTVNGFYLGTDGLSIGSNFTVTNTGDITAANVDISGVIKATSGYIGSNATNKITIGNNSTNASIYSGSHSSLGSTNSGFYIGTDGLSIGSKFKYVGGTTETLVVDNITATNLTINSGSIGSDITIGGKAQSDYLNSNVQVGGRNLARGTSSMAKGDGLWSSGTWRDSGASSTYNYTVNDSPVASVNKGVLITTASAGVRYGIAQDHCPLLSKMVTYSVWAKGTAGGTITLQSVWWNGITNVPNWTKSFTTNGSWQYLTLTTDITNATVPDGNCSICYMYWAGVNANDTCVFVAPKLEYGTKATDWTPAPEDVQAEIDAKKSTHTLNALWTDGTQYTETYANLLSYATEGRTGLGCRVASIDGINVGDTVRLAFKASDMGSSGTIVYIIGTVDSTSVGSYPSLFWTSHGLDTTVIDGGHILTGTIDANSVNISNLTVGTAQSGWNGLMNSNIQVGGTNLFGYGSECKLLEGFTLTGAWNITTEDGFTCAHTSGAIGTTKCFRSNIPFTPKPKETVTFSAYIKVKNIVYGTTNPMCEFYFSGQTIDGAWRAGSNDAVYVDGVKVAIDSTYPMRFTSYISDTSWHHIAFVRTWDNYTFGNLPPYIYLRDATGDLYVRNIKYERGNKATDWTPAPEDVEAFTEAFSSAKQISTYARSFTKANWDSYGASGHSESWSASGYDNSHISVGDIAYINGSVSDKTGWYAAIIGTVTSVTASAVVMTSIKVAYNSSQAEKYITKVNDAGIRIHPSSTEDNSVVINASGMEVFKGGTAAANSVAFYGDTARVGKIAANSGNTRTTSTGMDLYVNTTKVGGLNQKTNYVDPDTVPHANALFINAVDYFGVINEGSSTTRPVIESSGSYLQLRSNNATLALTGDSEEAWFGLNSGNTDSFDSSYMSFTNGDGTTIDVGVMYDWDDYGDEEFGIWTENTPTERWLIGGTTEGHVMCEGIYLNTSSSGSNVRTIQTISGQADYQLRRYVSSSRRYKEDIADLTDSELDADRLYDLRAVQFRYKDDYLESTDPRYGKLVSGFIAEEVEEAYPIAVQYEDEMPEDWEPKFIIPPMLKLIQDQKKKIDELEQRLEMLERR